MLRTRSGRDLSFFWQFVNDTHSTADRFKRMVQLASQAFLTRSSPCCWRHSLSHFLSPSAIEPRSVVKTNSTVLPLLRGDRLEEGEGAEKTGMLKSPGGLNSNCFVTSNQTQQRSMRNGLECVLIAGLHLVHQCADHPIAPCCSPSPGGRILPETS